MPLFRFHRGGLEESLSTTIVVKTFNDVVKAVVTSDLVTNQDWPAKFNIIPYPNEKDNFDSRIGWYTHAFLTNVHEENKMDIVGFLSEPLE